jgi:hypothetical protein
VRRSAGLGIGVAGLALAGLSYIGLFGLIVVHDETGAVTSAVLTNGRSEQPLLRLPGGPFVGVPSLEGTVEVRCPSGARARWGYVTGYSRTFVRVIGSVPCGRLVDG